MSILTNMASTTQGRRGLIHLSVLTGNTLNEMVFVICALEYKRKPTKTRAIIIHQLFLSGSARELTVTMDTMQRALPAVVLAFQTNVIGLLENVPTNKILRKLTAFRRVPPRDLFDPLVRVFEVHFSNFCPTEQDAQANLRIIREMLSVHLGGTGGGGAAREMNDMMRKARWSQMLCRHLHPAFDPVSLGISDVFSARYLPPPLPTGG